MKEKDLDNSIRLDKWLWAARFYKTRSLATDMIAGGKVHYNEQRCKPSKTVELGAKISLRQGYDEKEVIVLEVHDKRRKASEAQLMYQETAESIAKREKMLQARKDNPFSAPHPEKRPNKKERRDLLKLKY